VKLPRLLAIWLLIFGTSFLFIPFANATAPELMVRDVKIICANPAGETYTANTGWDADNSYFNGRGDIARLFCEGGFIGQWTTYISDNYTGIGRYYNGIAPTPTVSPSPEPSAAPEPSPSPTPSETATPVVETATPVVETVTPVLTPSPEPEPLPSPEETQTITIIETSTPLSETSTVPSEPVPSEPQPEPVVIIQPQPVVVPPPPEIVEPSPTPEPEPEPQPEPEVEPEPVPEPEPEEPPAPVEEPPAPVEEPPAPVEEEEPPLPAEEPPVEAEEPPAEEVPAPVILEPAPELAPEPPVEEPEPPVVATEDSTPEEREIIAKAVIEAAQGEAVTAQAIQDAGLTYEDLPPETPVEVRQDEDGNEVVITAEVAAALVVLENPAALVAAIFTDPAQALLAIASIGADMSDEERIESEKIIVASVIAGQAAVNAAGMAGAAAYRRKP
jgi:hypothetical protein